MSSSRAGRFVRQSTGASTYQAFSPKPLPPDPPLAVDGAMQDRLERAGLALGRLDGISRILPDPDLFLYMYVRKEAVLSSQIEGTQSSLSDLLLFEIEAEPGVPTADVREVSSYVAALRVGLDLLRTKLPLSLRLLREMHRVLVTDTRGGDKTPGEFRRSQNWVGGSMPGNARYVPPPAHEVMPALGALEKFLHDDPVRTPTLLKAGLAHAQFESIHPFLDGNGRIGRMLITLLFVAEGVLAEPLLYVSLYFRQHRSEYYERLQRVRTDGDWEGWMSFYLDGVAYVADQATTTAGKLVRLFDADGKAALGSGGATQSTLHVFELLRRRAVLSIPAAAKQLSLSKPTVGKAVSELVRLGIAREITGKRRDRQFIYGKYVDLMNEDIGSS
jgi:Fic family protein